MIDTFAIWMLLVALLFAPEGKAEIRLDQVDAPSGRVEALTAARTPEGFTVKGAAGAGEVRFVRAKGGAYDAHLPGMPEPIRLEAGTVTSAGGARERTAGTRAARAVAAGDLEYVFGREGEEASPVVIVLRGGGAEKPAAPPAK